jgi:hypothetical protein
MSTFWTSPVTSSGVRTLSSDAFDQILEESIRLLALYNQEEELSAERSTQLGQSSPRAVLPSWTTNSRTSQNAS